MRKVIFWDKSYVLIDNDKEDALVEAMRSSKGFWLTHAGGRDWVTPGSISRITSAGREGVTEDNKLLTAPKTVFDPNGPGYKKFQEARKKLQKRFNI